MAVSALPSSAMSAFVVPVDLLRSGYGSSTLTHALPLSQSYNFLAWYVQDVIRCPLAKSLLILVRVFHRNPFLAPEPVVRLSGMVRTGRHMMSFGKVLGELLRSSPDMTFAVDWALKTIIYLSLSIWVHVFHRNPFLLLALSPS